MNPWGVRIVEAVSLDCQHACVDPGDGRRPGWVVLRAPPVANRAVQKARCDNFGSTAQCHVLPADPAPDPPRPPAYSVTWALNGQSPSHLQLWTARASSHVT